MLCHTCFRRPGVYRVMEKTAVAQATRIICRPCHQGMGKELRIADLPRILLRLIHGVWIQKARSERDELAERTCPACHFRWQDFKAAGQLGCGQCYQVFRVGIQRILEDSFGIGDFQAVIAEDEPNVGLADFRRMLLRALDGAVHKEDYETAALIRDKVRKLEEMALE